MSAIPGTAIVEGWYGSEDTAKTDRIGRTSPITSRAIFGCHNTPFGVFGALSGCRASVGKVRECVWVAADIIVKLDKHAVHCG